MVKIQRIKLQNYKSLRDLDFELHDLNILIGRNGSGKSNLLSFFRLLQSAANEQLSATINLMGGISEIRWKGAQRSESVSWRIIFSDLQEADSIYYIGDIVPRGNGFAISKEEITYPPHFGHGEDYKFLGAYNGAIRFLHRKQTSSENEHDNNEDTTPDSNINFDYNDRELVLAQVRDPISYPVLDALRRTFNDWAIFRGFGENAILHIYDSQSLDIVSPLRLNPDGRNLISVLYAIANDPRYLDVQDELEQTLHDALPEFRKLQFPLSASGKAELKWVNQNGWDFTARSTSDGMLRFLGLATLLLLPEPPALIAIDEPEVGLHPRLIPLLSSLLKIASKRTQVIVATHSPQLIGADVIEPEDVVVVDKIDGETHMKHLEAEELRLWLEQYTLGQLWTLGKLES